MHSMDNYYVSKLLPLIAEAQVAAIPNPLINIMHPRPPRHLSEAARHDPRAGDDQPRHPRRLGPGLRARPVVSRSARPTCWTSPSWACMSRRCRAPPTWRHCFDMVTRVNAEIMGLDHLGLAVGKRASLVVLDAGDPVEAHPAARRAALRDRPRAGGGRARAAGDPALAARTTGGRQPPAQGQPSLDLFLPGFEQKLCCV